MGTVQRGAGTSHRPAAAVVSLRRIDAVIFDLDGVVTDTASIHQEAWAATFDELLEQRGHERFTPEDYRRYVDGVSRIDGIRSFLRARRIDLPLGEPDDQPGTMSMHAIATAKNARFLALLEQRGGRPYPTTVSLVRTLRARGVHTAIISASRNCEPILRAAGIADLFDAKVDGIEAAALGLPGKPDPAVFLEAARRLGVAPARAAVVEDAIAGVKAARAGAFGLVIAVDRAGFADALADAGADVVVRDLGEVRVA